jgi:Aldo/keto reductase family
VREIYVPKLGRAASVLGFGCASLGSRVSEAIGRCAVDLALDLGVTWFDVAPPYGDGRAEDLLGRMLQGRRDKVIICTKFGIDRPRVPMATGLLRPLARRVVTTIPKLRRFISKGRPSGQRVPIRPSMIERWVKNSLRLLRTDYIDVLAMHEPSPEEAANPDNFDALCRLTDKGLVRTVAIAGAPESIEAGISDNRSFDIAQFCDSPFANIAPTLRTRLPHPTPMFVTHGVFGSDVTNALKRMPTEQRAKLVTIAEHYGCDISANFNELLLLFAFSNNPGGVVITSMFHNRHIERNVGIAQFDPGPTLALEVREGIREC